MTDQLPPPGDVEPKRSRPHIHPSYRIAIDEEGMLPWSWAVERLASADKYWMATTRPDGRPHVKPVWGVWVDGTLSLETGPVSRAGRNLAIQPSIAVHIERGEDVVILEGVAEEVDGLPPELAVRIADAFGAKYGSSGYRPSPSQYQRSKCGL